MSDHYAPTNQTLDAQGRPTADFAGHVSADGLDLPAGVSATPPDDSRVRWLDPSFGPVATIFGYLFDGLELLANPDRDPGLRGEINLRAQSDDNNARIALVAPSSSTPGTLASIALVCGPNALTLIDELGASDFALDADVAALGAARLALVAGDQGLTADFGSTTIAAPGTPTTSVAGIAHSLPSAPTRMLCQSRSALVNAALSAPLAGSFTINLAHLRDATNITTATVVDWAVFA